MLQVTAHVKRIEAVEKDLKALNNASATREDLSRQRAEMKKLYDGLHIGSLCLFNLLVSVLIFFIIELLDVKAHLWGVRTCFLDSPGLLCLLTCLTEKDMQALTKKEGSSVRV